MKVEFKSSFAKDLRKIKDVQLRAQVGEIIQLIERAPNLQNIENLKKLKGNTQFFRIRVGDYRMGLAVHGEIVVFVRFLHRKDIYRYFP